jgi:4-carboxymuconolactone decarboxylase
MGTGAEPLLRGLASGDQAMLRSVLAFGVIEPSSRRRPMRALEPATATLVNLAALLAAGASTTSLRWAVERALHEGADEQQILEVLMNVAATAGSARVVAAAPRLALAFGYDVGIESPD